VHLPWKYHLAIFITGALLLAFSSVIRLRILNPLGFFQNQDKAKNSKLFLTLDRDAVPH
jgi:hypothetical protein